MRFDPGSNTEKLWNLYHLLTEKWKLPKPSLVLTVTGGPVATNYSQQYFQLEALTKLVSDMSE